MPERIVIVVEVKNEILGDSEFWRGPPERIGEIRNIPARETAKQVVKDGRARRNGMWHVRAEGVEAHPIWPIAKLVIVNGQVAEGSRLYAPGLPDGEHDVYPLPVNSAAEPLPAGVMASHPSPTIQGVIDGMTKLIDQWHDGPNNPDMWMAAAAGALSGARALLQDAPEVANGVTRLDGEMPGQNHQGVDASGFGEGNRGS